MCDEPRGSWFCSQVYARYHRGVFYHLAVLCSMVWDAGGVIRTGLHALGRVGDVAVAVPPTGSTLCGPGVQCSKIRGRDEG